MHVVGKGRNARAVTVPAPELAALQLYLQATAGASSPAGLPPGAPLLQASDGGVGVTYAAVREAFVGHAARAWALPQGDRGGAATLHWLRHTFATRSAEAVMPQDVLTAEQGHADPKTSAGYYTAQRARRRAEAERVAAQNL